MKKTLSTTLVVLLPLLFLLPFGAPGCKTAPVSEQVVAARVVAGAPVTLKAIKRVAAVLATDGTLSAAQVSLINAKTDKVKAAVDQVAGSIEAGKFDDLKSDTALLVIEQEFSAVLAIFGKNLSPEVKELVILAQALVPSIRAVIKRLKPAPVATPALDKAGENHKKNKITPAQILTIAIIAGETGAILLDIRFDSNLESLRAKFHQYSQAY